jgi:hypothetical protein
MTRKTYKPMSRIYAVKSDDGPKPMNQYPGLCVKAMMAKDHVLKPDNSLK